jgi:DNA primase
MDFAQQLKSSIDIVAVVGERVRLNKMGARYRGLCPFHTEKTPSFYVTPSHQYFKCFGCGEGGTVIDFVMKIDGLTFWEACKTLAERYAIPLPKKTWESDETTRKRAGIYDMNELALKAFRDAFRGPAVDYLKKRGVTGAVAEEFGLGYADGSLVRRLQAAGFGPDQLRVSGLVSERQDGSGFFDRFRNRLMFPIHNETGKVVGFAGRALSDEDEPKYLNSPETDLYKKSYLLYNLHRARKVMRTVDHAILVEGYMDVIGLHGGGVGEVVASCGTSLVSTQVQILRRHTQNIVVNFDPDIAGAKATERSIQMLLEEGMHIRVLELPGELDPDEFIQERGAEAYRELLKKAPRYFYWLAERVRKRMDVSSAEGKVEAARFLLPSIQRLHDKFERAAVATEMAHQLGIDKGLMLEQVRGLGGEKRQTAKVTASGIPQSERLLLTHMLTSGAARRAALARLAGSRPMAQPSTLRILDAMQAMGESFSFEALEARLEDKEKTLLSSLIFADEGSQELVSGDEISLAQVEECLNQLSNAGEESAVMELKARIAQSEREGRLQEALELSVELQRAEGARKRRRTL